MRSSLKALEGDDAEGLQLSACSAPGQQRRIRSVVEVRVFWVGLEPLARRRGEFEPLARAPVPARRPVGSGPLECLVVGAWPPELHRGSMDGDRNRVGGCPARASQIVYKILAAMWGAASRVAPNSAQMGSLKSSK